MSSWQAPHGMWNVTNKHENTCYLTATTSTRLHDIKIKIHRQVKTK